MLAEAGRGIPQLKPIMVNFVLRKRPILAATLLWTAFCPPAPAGEAPPALRHVVSDWRTGLALHGIDPVAYFTEGRAIQGSAQLEHGIGPVTWRFRNEGNRAAFTRDPLIYAPRLGGYDPIAVARGVATPGNPLVFVVSGERLYLFHSPASRDAFLADTRRWAAQSEARWPGVADTLDRTGAIGEAAEASGAPPPAPTPPSPPRR